MSLKKHLLIKIFVANQYLNKLSGCILASSINITRTTKIDIDLTSITTVVLQH